MDIDVHIAFIRLGISIWELEMSEKVIKDLLELDEVSEVDKNNLRDLQEKVDRYRKLGTPDSI